MPNDNICILLATYNGARYVREQIASIQRQTVSEWRLLVRDDGSTDGTCDVLNQTAAEDDRVTILNDAEKSAGGAAQNFSKLMIAGLHTESHLFFLCDQDDIWEPTKLEVLSREFALRGREAAPLLVHSDLAVVDESLRSIHPSLICHMSLEPEPRQPLNYLLTRNFVTGCATACNRRLLEEALPISSKAIMHDWWLAAIAAATGKILYIAKPLVQYRQHSTNTIGAKGFWHGLNPTNNWLKGWQAGNREFLATFDQVEALYLQAKHRDTWPEQCTRLLQEYKGLLEISALRRPLVARKLRLRQGNLLLQLIYYLRLVTIHRASSSGRIQNPL